MKLLTYGFQESENFVAYIVRTEYRTYGRRDYVLPIKVCATFTSTAGFTDCWSPTDRY